MVGYGKPTTTKGHTMDTIEDARCLTCDGRYCPAGECAGQPGDVWMNGPGWTNPADAALADSRVVNWQDVWSVARYGNPA